MKLISIKNCGGCPYFRKNHQAAKDWCVKDKEYRNIDVRGIPDWCPLENADPTAFCEHLLKAFDNKA